MMIEDTTRLTLDIFQMDEDDQIPITDLYQRRPPLRKHILPRLLIPGSANPLFLDFPSLRIREPLKSSWGPFKVEPQDRAFET